MTKIELPLRKEFISNKKLLTYFKERQLIAIYELLTDIKLGANVIRRLLELNLIKIQIKNIPDDILPGFTKPIKIIELI